MSQMSQEAKSVASAALEVLARGCERKVKEAEEEIKAVSDREALCRLFGQADAYSDVAELARHIAGLLEKKKKLTSKV